MQNKNHPPPPPWPPSREFQTTLFGGYAETKQSIQRRRDYDKFMRGYMYALGHPNIPQPGDYV